MSLKSNVIANYASQIYVTLIGIVMVPMYVGYMGAEAYGLVGFFAMLQAWFQLLDMGLSPTMARETARYTCSAEAALQLRRLVRALEAIFFAVAVTGSACLVLNAGWLAASWLNVEILSAAEVEHAIMLMALNIGLRWMSGLYRGAISGFERLVWLSGFNMLIATCRFILVIPFFLLVSTTPTAFFSYQAVIALIELAVLLWQTYRLLPPVAQGARVNGQWGAIRGILRFSLAIAFTSGVWVLVTQTDKLVLSKLLSLSDYAYFTLAVLVAGGVGVISGPISGALLPRMTRLSAEGNDAEVIRLYRNATQLVTVIAVPTALMLACFAEQILWAWTGNPTIAARSAPVLTLYAVGNGILALGAFPYYLQFAKGDLRLHMIGNLFFVVVLIPALVWATLRFGVRGAGAAWLCTNIAYFLIWVPRVHTRFVRGLHRAWLCEDVAATALPPVLTALALSMLVHWPQGRVQVALLSIALGLLLLGIAALASSYTRRALGHLWTSRLAA